MLVCHNLLLGLTDVVLVLPDSLYIELALGTWRLHAQEAFTLGGLCEGGPGCLKPLDFSFRRLCLLSCMSSFRRPHLHRRLPSYTSTP